MAAAAAAAAVVSGCVPEAPETAFPRRRFGGFSAGSPNPVHLAPIRALWGPCQSSKSGVNVEETFCPFFRAAPAERGCRGNVLPPPPPLLHEPKLQRGKMGEVRPFDPCM